MSFFFAICKIKANMSTNSLTKFGSLHLFVIDFSTKIAKFSSLIKSISCLHLSMFTCPLSYLIHIFQFFFLSISRNRLVVNLSLVGTNKTTSIERTSQLDLGDSWSRLESLKSTPSTNESWNLPLHISKSSTIMWNKNILEFRKQSMIGFNR